MGPKDVVKAVEFLQPATAILMHYDTFDVIAQDAPLVADAIAAQTSARPALLKPGESLVV
jgi:L-ascorbate metabolism protein UlaG (beta-lactamase superfamily)